jgi:hypothetical protein
MTLHKGNKCDLCSRPLQVIHCKRANGKSYRPDWRGRRLHKKCFHEICRNWPAHIERTVARMTLVARYLNANPSNDLMWFRMARALSDLGYANGSRVSA